MRIGTHAEIGHPKRRGVHKWGSGGGGRWNSGGRSGEGRYDEGICAPREANVDIELYANGQKHNLELLLVLQ